MLFQAKMAEIFTEIFGEKLETEEALVKVNGQDRLPSPHQLQGKIILKGPDQLSKSPKKSPVRRIDNNFDCMCLVFIHY